MKVILKYIGSPSACFTKGRHYEVVSFVGNSSFITVCDKNTLADAGSALDQNRWELVSAGEFVVNPPAKK